MPNDWRFAGAFAALLLTLLFGPSALAQTGSAAPAKATTSPIMWRLKNPFRYFTKPEHFAFYAEAARAHHAANAADVVLATERTLAEKTDGRGWAAGIFEHVVDEACWYTAAAAPNGNGNGAAKGANGNTGKANGNSEACGAYIKPKFHVVVLQAPGIAGACTWTLGATRVDKADCRQPAEMAIAYPEGGEVVLTSARAEVAREIIKVEDLLIVGMGDSFGAGDGNPDRPVSFRGNRPLSYDAERDGYPQRNGVPADARYSDPRFRNKGAGWVHRGCHRSLYSHQLRTALHLALDDVAGKRAVTYLGLACSGSTMLSMFGVYNGYEDPVSNADPVHAKRKLELSQVDILAHALCEPGSARVDTETNYNEGEYLEIGDRKIHAFACPPEKRLRTPDLVLLSVGGNDVGFAGLVSNAALRNRFLGYVKLFDEDPRITPENANVFMGRIPGRYAALAKAIGNISGISAKRVVLTAYPDMDQDADGKVCASGTRGMDVGVAWQLEGKAVAATQKFMDDVLTPGMEQSAKAAGWTFAWRHRSEGHFQRHGLCAVTREELEDPALANIQFPRFKDVDGLGTWGPFKPADYRPYATRQRFFLTPNDAFLASHFHTTHIPILDGGPEVQIALWSAWSGAFHPTAEGQAVMADAVLWEARRLLASAEK
ncbi:MAG: hypothetical protein EKK41_08065 [Hyphomicrobiales bacterium]|nr:MAG: hypothetical protein EKK41_08065 [Hyphomicrobiales bacterium]